MADKDPVVKQDEDRLEHLEEDISEARQHLKQQTHAEEREFIDEGQESQGETDDTIAPG